MAASAIRPEFAVMNVIRLVAIGTVAAESHLRLQWLPMTGFTVDASVCPVEPESGLCIVIEKCLLPLDRVVAKRALFAEASAVGIVLLVAVNALLRRVAEHVRVMTLGAVLLVVFAKKREAGQAMVEKDLVLPGVFVVAVCTRCSQRAVVSIVFFVAGQAVSGQRRIENGLDMAGRAFDVRVRAVEGVAGVQGMIELHLGPSDTHMARLALPAEMALVVVVFLVTSDALHGELVRKRIVAMASVAVLLRMFVIERKASVATVIKAGVVPAERAVACTTLVAAAPFVRIILGMASVARRRRIGERIVGVTVEAGRFLVFAD